MLKPAVVAWACHPRTWEADVGGRPQVQVQLLCVFSGQSGLQSKILCRKTKKEEKNKCGGQWTFLFSLKTLAIFLLHHVPNQVLIPFCLVLGVVNFVFFCWRSIFYSFVIIFHIHYYMFLVSFLVCILWMRLSWTCCVSSSFGAVCLGTLTRDEADRI